MQSKENSPTNRPTQLINVVNKYFFSCFFLNFKKFFFVFKILSLHLHACIYFFHYKTHKAHICPRIQDSYSFVYLVFNIICISPNLLYRSDVFIVLCLVHVLFLHLLALFAVYNNADKRPNLKGSSACSYKITLV